MYLQKAQNLVASHSCTTGAGGLPVCLLGALTGSAWQPVGTRVNTKVAFWYVPTRANYMPTRARRAGVYESRADTCATCGSLGIMC
jgi:hypothetical protein